MPAETTKSLIIKRFIQILLDLFLQAAVLFLASGHLYWLAAWAYLGVHLAAVAVNSLVLLARGPDLIAERARIKEGTKGWDKILALLVSTVGPMTILLLAGLDERFAWTPWLALPLRWLGLLSLIAGYALFGWAMAANPFFSGTVRIQKERGHTAVQTGPYRLVRHPGYLGLVLNALGTPVFLGSLWAYIPAFATAVLLVLRTALEDRTLRAELPGYKEYADRVRHKLVPLVW